MTLASVRSSDEGARRLPKRERTAAVIEEAALRLFAERGFETVTAEEIARQANVARRTVFRNFPGGKEEIVLRELRGRMEKLRETLEDRPPQESALAALRASLLNLVVGYEDDIEGSAMRASILESSPSLAARAMGEQIRLTESLIRLIALRLAADPSNDLRPGIIVAASLAAMNEAHRVWLSPGNTRGLPDIVEQALDLVSSGLDEIGERVPAPAPSSRRAQRA